MNLLDYVGMVKVLHLAQQRHLSDHEGRDPGFRRVSVDGELLHREEALFLSHLSGFVHFTIVALPYFCQELIAQGLSADAHCS